MCRPVKSKDTGCIEIDDDSAMLELCAVARRGGAEDAIVISTDDVLVDPRVRFKCMITPCYQCGACRNCPPYGCPTEQTRSLIQKYRKAVFFRIIADARSLSSPGLSRGLRTGKVGKESGIIAVGAFYLLCNQVTVLVEKQASRYGYEPVGFAAGDCKEVLCFFHPACRAIGDRERCRHPDLSRPSMEASGMDVFGMAANAGWEIYPVGSSCRPGDVPRASLLGLVLVY